MKTQFKICLFLLSLGWFAFMFICLWGMSKEVEIRLTIFLSGVAVCIFGAFTFTSLLHNKGFWMLNDELNKEIEKTRESKKSYEKAEKLYLNKILSEEGLSKK